MYQIQWQSKGRIVHEGVPLQCEDVPRLHKELIDWYALMEETICDWKSPTQVKILYPVKKIGKMRTGETLQVFEVISEVLPEYVLVTYIDTTRNL